MGFFSSIKKNMNRGGVKIDFDSPNTVSFNDKSFDVRIKISADSEQKINKLNAELVRFPTGNNDNSPSQEQVSGSELKESFSIGAGETKEFTITLPVNAKGLFEDQPEGAGKAVADALGKLGSLVQALDRREFDYSVIVSADVEGINFDPSKQHTIQVLRPGEIGGNIKIGS